MIISARAAKNRGVEINEEGKKLPAKPTYFGGTTSMCSIDKKRAQLEDRPYAGQSLESYVFTHVKKIKNIAEDELYTGRNDLHWPNEKYKDLFERYMIGLTDKYKDNPNAMPLPLDPMDASVWNKAVGKVKEGNLPGISAKIRPEAMDFPTKKCHTLSIVSRHQVEEIHNLQTEVVELRSEIQMMKSEVEQNVMQKVEAMLRGRFSEERGMSSRASDTVEQREDVYIPDPPEQHHGVNGFDLDGLELND